MPPEIQTRYNDCVIKFANVNGSGSASANALFAKAILRMGVPVSPRNIFPSNIQGLPTWYEIRVNRDGHTARTPAFDLVHHVLGLQVAAHDRIVFEPYTKETFHNAREWITEHGMFPDGNLGSREYEQSVIRLAI